MSDLRERLEALAQVPSPYSSCRQQLRVSLEAARKTLDAVLAIVEDARLAEEDGDADPNVFQTLAHFKQEFGALRLSLSAPASDDGPIESDPLPDAAIDAILDVYAEATKRSPEATDGAYRSGTNEVDGPCQLPATVLVPQSVWRQPEESPDVLQQLVPKGTDQRFTAEEMLEWAVHCDQAGPQIVAAMLRYAASLSRMIPCLCCHEGCQDGCDCHQRPAEGAEGARTDPQPPIGWQDIATAPKDTYGQEER